MNNLTYIMQHLMEWSMQGYTIALDVFVFPLIFSSIIGYIFLKNSSALSAAVAIIIVFTCLAGTGWIASVSGLAIFFQIVVVLSITGLILYLVTRRRGGV